MRQVQSNFFCEAKVEASKIGFIVALGRIYPAVTNPELWLNSFHVPVFAVDSNRDDQGCRWNYH